MAAKNPRDREFDTVKDAVASMVSEPIWYVDTAEAVTAPYDPPNGVPSVSLDPHFFRY